MSQSPVRRRRSSSNPMTAMEKPELTKSKQAAPVLQFLVQPTLRILALVYGLILYTAFVLRGLFEGYFLKRPSPDFWSSLDSGRARHYDLSKTHPSGLHHAFHTLENNLRLHYLTNAPQDRSVDASGKAGSKKTKNVAIFFHGWPDTAAMWASVIAKIPDNIKAETTVIAVDLPGFGGSDSEAAYGPDDVLTAMTNFCIAMREQYLDDTLGGKVIHVSFDWGAVVGFRLAAHAPEIADRFIFTNSALPEAAKRNITERVHACQKLIKMWYRHKPTSFKRFRVSFGPLGPVFGQILKSGYIFTFNLPWILAQQTVLRCNWWLLRYINSIGFGHRGINDTPEVIYELAAYLGPPSTSPSSTGNSSNGFGASVHQRALAATSAAEPLKYYRQGLASKPWNRPLSLIVKLSDLADYNRTIRKKTCSLGATSQLPGALGAPATIIWGDKDPALDFRIMLEGIDDYLKKDSQVIRLPRIGHWVPKQGEGPAVLAAAVAWALGGEGSSAKLEAAVKGVCESARMAVAK